MRVSIERTYITTAHGTRILYMVPDRLTVEAANLSAAIVRFIESGGGRMLGPVTQVSETRAIATGWSEGRLYVIAAEPAPD